jgi:gas vesicle protein
MKNENGNSRKYGQDNETNSKYERTGYYEIRSKDKGSLIVGLITGAVAGAVTALLLAPNSGEETRRKLMRTTGKLREDINETVQSGIDRINALRGGLEDEVSGPTSGRVAKSSTGSSKNSGTSASGSGMASGSGATSGSGMTGSSSSGSTMAAGTGMGGATYSGTETPGLDSTSGSGSTLSGKNRGGTL